MSEPLLQKLSQAVLDLIFPPNCISCKTADNWLCPGCLNKIAFITTAICERCGTPSLMATSARCTHCADHPLRYIDGIRAAARFEDNPMREAIHFLKYHNHQAVAALLAKLLAEAYRRYALTINLIIPVPLHKSRLKERGYNQSELLARQLGYLLDLQVNSAILRRIRKTEAQVSLSRLERPANVADAFECNHHLSGQHVLLIDDVCTTGSTLDACAKALKARGADLVWGLTLARA